MANGTGGPDHRTAPTGQPVNRWEEAIMVECPRCGDAAEYVAGEAFVLVWCSCCVDLIEVGDLVLQPASSPAEAGLAAPR